MKSYRPMSAAQRESVFSRDNPHIRLANPKRSALHRSRAKSIWQVVFINTYTWKYVTITRRGQEFEKGVAWEELEGGGGRCREYSTCIENAQTTPTSV